MKYLEIPSLTRLTGLLTDVVVGPVSVSGQVACYSCKAAGTDKAIAREVEATLKDELDTSHSLVPVSPLGPVADKSTRTLLVNLIAVMNMAFPEHDFGSLKPESFMSVPTLKQAVNDVNACLSELTTAEEGGFLEGMWAEVNAVIKVEECDIYSYIPDLEDDPFSQGSLWSFNYFFHNKEQKQILYFACVGRSSAGAGVGEEDDDMGGGGDGDDDGGAGVADDDLVYASQGDPGPASAAIRTVVAGGIGAGAGAGMDDDDIEWGAGDEDNDDDADI